MRVVLRCCAGLLLLLVVVWVFALGRQWMMRWRAERLLADIQALNVSKSTGADAERIVERWKKWRVPAEGRSCTRDDCAYQILLSSEIPYEYGFGFSERESRHSFARVLDRLGLRPSYVSGFLEVRHSVVILKEFKIEVARPVRLWDVPDDGSSWAVAAWAGEGAHLRVSHPSVYVGDIYSAVRRAPHGELVAESTPLEPLQHRQELMAFRFECITNWVPCRNTAQLLPKAAEELAVWSRKEEANDRTEHNPSTEISDCTGRYLEFLARESDEVWVVSAEATPERDPQDTAATQYRLSVQPEQVLKGRGAPSAGAIQTMEIRKQLPAFASDKSAKLLLFGSFENDLPDHAPYFETYACSFTSVTDENIAVVRQGIAEDFDPSRR